MSKYIFKRVASIFIIFTIIFINLSPKAYAGTWGMNQAQSGLANVAIVMGVYQSEKTVDLTEGDRTKLPNADFNFVLSEADKEGYDIGKEYHDETGYVAVKIEKGVLPEGKDMHFTTVSFRETDVYHEEENKVLKESNDLSEISKITFDNTFLSRVEKGEDGLYNKVSKPLITIEEYKKIRDSLRDSNYDNPDVIYRFLLRESYDPKGEYLENTDVKIVDLLPYSIAYYMLIFNDTKQADEFYKKLLSEEFLYGDEQGGESGDIYRNLFPRSEFVNKVAPPPKEPPTPKEPPKEEPPKPPKSPDTSDNNQNEIYLGLFSLSLLMFITLSKKKSK